MKVRRADRFVTLSKNSCSYEKNLTSPDGIIKYYKTINMNLKKNLPNPPNYFTIGASDARETFIYSLVVTNS